MKRCPHCDTENYGRQEKLGICSYCFANLDEDDVVSDVIEAGLSLAVGLAVDSLFSSDSPGSSSVSGWSGDGGESGGGGASGEW